MPRLTPSPIHLRLAVRHLRAGGVIAYPTEGVWGLGCDPDNIGALLRLLLLKQRDPAKGLILIAASEAQLAPRLAPLSAAQQAALRASWPGPVTWIVPHNKSISLLVTGGRSTVAARVSAHPIASALCRAFGGPLISTSANPSGRPAATSALAVRRYFGDQLDYILPGALGGRRGPSEIRDLLNDKLLRG
ncbi:MAG: L-threonylcarbamoyladenylate synthase [Spongiibacteraceae bacterium]|jgi:L-threonylcarbamoyladenylate synthase|nr:L-threonylcarbamoyladenylate synthase [Spongiibacteraceae bacterium]